MAFWNRKKKRTTAKPKINASISKVEKTKENIREARLCSS